MRAAGVSWVPRGLTCGRVDAHRGRRGGFRAGGSGRGALPATGAALSPLLVVWPLLWLSRRGKDPQRGGQHHGQLHGQLQGPQPQGAQVLWWGPSGQNRLGWGLQGADVCWGGAGQESERTRDSDHSPSLARRVSRHIAAASGPADVAGCVRPVCRHLHGLCGARSCVQGCSWPQLLGNVREGPAGACHS